MNILVAMESPISAVAIWPASTKSTRLSLPQALDDFTASTPASGNCQSGFFTKAAVDDPVELIGRDAYGLRPCATSASRAGGNNQVAADYQIGAAGADAGRVQIGSGGPPDARATLPGRPSAPGRSYPAQSAPLFFDVRRHGQDLTHGHYASTADTGDQDAKRRARSMAALASAAAACHVRHRRRLQRRPSSAFFSAPPSTVTKLGQKPVVQEKSLLHDD